MRNRMSAWIGVALLAIAMPIAVAVGEEAQKPALPETVSLAIDGSAHWLFPQSGEPAPLYFEGKAFPPADPKQPVRLEIAMTCTTGPNLLSHTRSDRWIAQYPAARVGMVLPVSGGIARIEAIDKEISFRILPEVDVPPGVVPPQDGFPMFLDVPQGNLKVTRIGFGDIPSALTADVTHSGPVAGIKAPAVKPEQFSRLSVGSKFELREDDWITEYRVAQIVPPDDARGIHGWITLRPVGLGIRERYDESKLPRQPETITVPTAGKSYASLYYDLNAAREIHFTGTVAGPNDRDERHIRTWMEQRTGPNGAGHTTWDWVHTLYPPLSEGMVVPLCGGVGRVESVGDEIKFKMLPTTEFANGMAYPRNGFPLMPRFYKGIFKFRSITEGYVGLRAEVVHTFSERCSNIGIFTIGGGFTLFEAEDLPCAEYTSTEMVAPDPNEGIGGWISIRQRYRDDAEPMPTPPSKRTEQRDATCR